MLSLRSLAFILCSAIRRARSLSCAALHCFADRILRTYYDYAGLIGLHTEDRMGNTQALIAEIYSAFNHRNTMVHWRG